VSTPLFVGCMECVYAGAVRVGVYRLSYTSAPPSSQYAVMKLITMSATCVAHAQHSDFSAPTPAPAPVERGMVGGVGRTK
jgi:hypothetical protein